jgi:tRNA pseudouridine13 synthase
MKWRIPYLTEGLPGVGGRIRERMEDFLVEEVPAYEASGEGEHTFFEVEKRDLSTRALVKQVARALDIVPRDVGYAGLKDARAVARQTLSVWDVPPERLEALELENARVLWARRHKNKLKVGHLRGNRFTLRVRAVHANAEERAVPIFTVLKERGVPNGYGVQRFGNRGDNHEVGLMLVRDDWESLRARGIRHLRFWQRRFYVSSLQSALFNHYLTRRMKAGTMDDLLLGDLAKKHDTGGMFVVEDAAGERPRVAAWGISATGPIYGYKMREAQETAGALEDEVLAEVGLALEDFRPVKAKGTRRFLRYRPEGLTWRVEGGSLLLSFFAPKGAYATMLLREVMKTGVGPDADEDEEE